MKPEFTFITRQACRPCCYIFYNRAKVPVYVGFSSQGLPRLFQHFRAEWFKSVASIEVRSTKTTFEALELERALIKKWRPRFNVQLTGLPKGSRKGVTRIVPKKRRRFYLNSACYLSLELKKRLLKKAKREQRSLPAALERAAELYLSTPDL